jgi:uncharacterized membrane protein
MQRKTKRKNNFFLNDIIRPSASVDGLIVLRKTDLDRICLQNKPLYLYNSMINRISATVKAMVLGTILVSCGTNRAEVVHADSSVTSASVAAIIAPDAVNTDTTSAIPQAINDTALPKPADTAKPATPKAMPKPVPAKPQPKSATPKSPAKPAHPKAK